MRSKSRVDSVSLAEKVISCFLSLVLVIGLSPSYALAKIDRSSSEGTNAEVVETPSVEEDSSVAAELAAPAENEIEASAQEDPDPEFVARSVVTELAYGGGTGTQDDPYLISTEADLVALSQAVNAGESQSGGYFKLTADIVVESADWAPIGIMNTSTDYPFAGTFDGDGHSVTLNYKRTSGTASPTGLFGYTKGSGISRGAATITGVIVKGSLSSSQSYLGGIVGFAANTIVEECRNEATITGYNNVGGIVGSCMKDGFTSTPNTVIVRRCHNAGAVSNTSSSYARMGGIIGAFGSGSESEISDCLNTGSVTAGGTIVAGICGYWYCASGGTAYMDNCLNTGVITGSSYSGSAAAIVASFGGAMSGDVSNYINNVYSQVLKVHAGTATTGTMLGYYYSNTQVSNYGLFTDAEMPLAATADTLGKYFAQTETAPVLRWEAPLNPTVGKVTVTGLTDEGGLEVGKNATFTVDARLPKTGDGASGTLSYAWYRATSAEVNPATDTPLEGNAKSIEASVPAGGTYYFYCVVTNTLNGESALLTSESVEVTAITGVEPATPEITSQPVGGESDQEGDDLTLSVGVNDQVSGIGTLTYQWYRAKGTEADPNNDELIADATAASYTASASCAGTYRYYCIVTNTFDLVSHSVTSDLVTFTVRPAEISSAEELLAFAARVNGSGIRTDDGDNVAGKTFVLTADIDLTDVAWTPIGTYYYDSYSISSTVINEFSGVFDGQDHTISGLNVQGENLSMWHTNYAGLFGYTDNATVRNLTVEGTVNTPNLRYVGGIAGYAAGNATFENLVFKGQVEGASRVGGIVGFSGESDGAVAITNCAAQGKVTAQAYAAGIVGVAGNTAVANCYNWAEIDCPAYAAGIVGSVYMGYNLGGVTIGNCYNVGNIDAADDQDDDTSDYYGAIVSDYATSYPADNYYLNTSCIRDAYLGSTYKNHSMTSADMRAASFVDTLNAATGQADALFVRSTTGGYPQFSWEKQTPACAVTLTVTPEEAVGAEVHVVDAAGAEQLAAVVEDAAAGTYLYYLPKGTYTVTARTYGYNVETFELVIDQTDEPITREIAMTAAPTQSVIFDVTAQDSASTTSAMLWLESSEYGMLKQGVRKASASTLELPAGEYTYTWVMADHMSVSGSFEVTQEGSEAGTIIRESVVMPVPIAWDGSVLEPVQNTEGYYLITRGEELAWCAERVNAGEAQTNMLLMAEIILNDSDNYANQWTPIGVGDYDYITYDVNPYAGDFNGQGYTVEGLYIDSEADNQGLFGVVSDGATFENFIVSGFVRTSGDCAAGVAAYLDTANVTFTNVGNEANVTASVCVGGVVGETKPGANCVTTLKYCYNKGNITATMATNYECDYAGGVVGCALTGGEDNLVIKSCYNMGDVLALAHTAGGILGTGACTIDGVYNTGTVTHLSASDVYEFASGAIIGVWTSTDAGVSVSNASYLEGSSERAFGYVSGSVSGEAAVFEGPEYFTTAVLVNYDGFGTRYGSTFNDGYPYLTWEDTSRVKPVVPAMPGSAENPYVISTADDLVALSESVAAGHTYAAEYVVLANDIDMEGIDFHSIGNYRNSSGCYFAGTFDGQGHCISNLSIDTHTTSYETDEGAGVGLFGHTRNATITHLEVTGNVSGTIWVGGIVGYGYATHVTNCLSRVNVNATSYEYGDGQGIYASGIVGQSFADVEGGGSVTGCAYYGYAGDAAITTLNTSKATVAGNYYLSGNNACGTDKGDGGATGVESLDSLEIAWNLNTLDGTQSNSLIWGLGEDGVCFTDGVDVLPSYRVLLDKSAALLSASPEYRYADEGTTVTINSVKKGYDLTSGVIAKTLSELGTYETVYSGAVPGEIPASYTIPAVDADLYVSVNATFDRSTKFDLSVAYAVEGDVSYTGAPAEVKFYSEDGEEITQAKRGDVVTARVSAINDALQVKGAGASGVYGFDFSDNVDIELECTSYLREYKFTVPDADVWFALDLEAKGTLPTQRDETLEVEANAFHVANAKYADNGTLLNADFIVDDDGTAGITTYYYSYPQQAVSTIYTLEGGLTSADYYSQLYSSLDEEGNRALTQYTGIDIERYLTKWCGMAADLADDTPVTFIASDGESVALTVGDLRGYAYSAYQVEGDYAGDFVARGLPVLLAAGAENEAFDPDELGPLCLVVGQTGYDEVGGGVLLSDVRKIVVGTVEDAQTITHNAEPYSDYLDYSIGVDVRREGELVGSYRITVAQLEAYVAEHPEAAVSEWITGSRFGDGGELQYTEELDHYQGANIWELLLADEELGLTEYDLADGMAYFYEEPTSSIDPQYSFVAETSLAYLAGTGEGGYAADETIVNGLTTTGVEPVLATAKNGLPLVRYYSDGGCVDDEYNYRGPFIAVLPCNEGEGVVVEQGAEKDAYISTFFGYIVLDLGEACDKTELEWLVDAVNKDMTGFVASVDGSDVAAGTSWVATEVWESLATALAAGEELIDSATATAAEVNAAYDALIGAWQVSMDERHEAADATGASVADDGQLGALSVEGAAGVGVEGADAIVSTDEGTETEGIGEAASNAYAASSFEEPATTKSVTTTDEGRYVSDEILVVFDDDTSKGTAFTALSTVEAVDESALAKEISAANLADDDEVVTIKLDQGVDVLDAVAEAEALPGVEYAQPNFVYTTLENDYIDALNDGMVYEATSDYTASSVYEPEYVPNDPALASTTPSSSSANAWHLDSINAFEAWDIVKTNNTVTVAVLDTGCYLTHEELASQVWTEYAWNSYLGSALTKDYQGHGTHVCGLVAAQANNGVGTAGASYNAKVLPIGVFDTSGQYCYTSTLVDAYDYLLGYADELNIHVVNMSLGGYGSLDSDDYALMGRIATAKNKNIVTVAAGGNGDDYGNPYTQASYPSDYEDCVAVTALSTDGKTPTTWCDYNANKDICAPGLYIYSTYYNSPSSYKVMSGTSMASPIVAGSMALLWAADPNLTVAEAKNLIYSTAAPLTVTSGREGLYGAGILDIYAAIQQLAGVVISNDVTSVYSGATLQMTCRSTSGESVEGAVWSVENGTGSATIDASTGVLSALMPGTVTVSVKLASAEEAADSITIDVLPLEMDAAPSTQAGSDGITVSWEANEYAAGYALERSSDGDLWVQIFEADADTLSYLDTEVEENQLYYYRVTPFSAVAKEGTGTASEAGCSMRFQLITLVDGETSLATSDEALDLAVDVFKARGITLNSLVLVPDSDDAWLENAAALSAAGTGYVVAMGAGGLSESALADVAALAPEEIIVLASEAQISDDMAAAVSEAAAVDGGQAAKVTRVTGNTRAAAAVAAAQYCLGGGTYGSTVIVCSPSHIDEAYAAAGYSQAAGAPILLTKDEAAPFAAQTLLTAKHFDTAIVLGNASEVAASADGYLSRQELSVSRVASASELSVMAQRAVSEDAASYAIVGVNASESPVLTQVAASFAGNLGGVLLGTDAASLASFGGHADEVGAVFVFGSADKTAAAGAAIEAALTGEPLGTLGDVNNSGRINIVDAQVAYDLARGAYGANYGSYPLPVGWTVATLFTVADVNADGALDAADAFAIQHYAHTGAW